MGPGVPVHRPERAAAAVRPEQSAVKRAVRVALAVCTASAWQGHVLCGGAPGTAVQDVTFTSTSDGTKQKYVVVRPETFTMPIGITASGKDTSVPPQSVLRLAGVLKAIGRDVLLIHRENMGHATTYADACAVLEFVVRKATQKKPRVKSGR